MFTQNPVTAFLLTKSLVRSRLVRFFAAMLIFSPVIVQATPRNSELATPPRLRDRVDFWKAVFTRYGENTLLVHHRMFPQIVFRIYDLSGEVSGLSYSAAQKVRVDREESYKNQVRQAVERLALGESPHSALENDVAEAMKVLGSGTAKYQRVLDEDLVRSQTGIRERYAQAIKRAGRYLPAMEQIFRSSGLPIELTRIPFIESSFDHNARSSVGALGIWQFMPATGKSYMTISGILDERRDPITATRAAALYLGSAYKRLKSWPLAITSYNHGVAGVARKVAEIGTSDISTIVEHPTVRPLGFASTNFFPEFLAAVEVYDSRTRNFPNLQQDNPISAEVRRTASPLSAAQASHLYNVSVEDLKLANLGITDAVWHGPARIPPSFGLNVPVRDGRNGPVLALNQPESTTVRIEVAPELRPQLRMKVEEKTVGRPYKVQKGESIGTIAKKFGIPVSQLLVVNSLKTKIIRSGQMLNIPTIERRLVATKQVPGRKPPAPIRYYTVRKGDSLSKIAAKLAVSAKVIAQSNGLTKGVIRPGMKLVLP